MFAKHWGRLLFILPGEDWLAFNPSSTCQLFLILKSPANLLSQNSTINYLDDGITTWFRSCIIPVKSMYTDEVSSLDLNINITLYYINLWIGWLAYVRKRSFYPKQFCIQGFDICLRGFSEIYCLWIVHFHVWPERP